MYTLLTVIIALAALFMLIGSLLFMMAMSAVHTVARRIANATKPELPTDEEMQHAEDLENLKAVFAEMGYGSDAPVPADFEAVQNRFHEKTDRYVRLFVTSPGKISSKFGVVMPEAPAEQPAAAAQAATHVPVATEPKPLTKSQQRRKNERAGKGPYTDEELKQQANERRRQARLAKKAAETQPAAEPKAKTLKEQIKEKPE